MTTPPPSTASDPRPRTGSTEADPVLAERSDADASDGSGQPPASSLLWRDALGRAGTRAAQLLLIAAVAIGVFWLLLRVQTVLIAVLVALILACAITPAVRWLVTKGWSHLWATLAAFLGILVVLGAVIGAVIAAIRKEWEALVSSAANGWEDLVSGLISGPLPVDTTVIQDAAQQVTDFLSSQAFANGVASNTLIGISVITEFLTGVVLMIVVLFFFLKDGSKIANFTLRWFQGQTRAKLAESADRSAEVLGGYVRGTATVALVDAVLIGLGLALVGVPLALPLAVIVFIGAFIPIVGATATGALAALVALLTTGPVEALIVVAIVIVVNQLEGNLLQPVVMGRTLGLHALIVLLALTIGTLSGGIFGAILAVPYTAVAWTLIQIWTTRYQTDHDDVLGEDPLKTQNRPAAKATLAQRWRYQRIRRQRRHNGPLNTTAEGTTTDDRQDEQIPAR